MSQRPSWEGYLKPNLLSVPVKAYTAGVSGKGRIGFHQLHAGCGSRINRAKLLRRAADAREVRALG